jgi:hypothetical protein
MKNLLSKKSGRLPSSAGVRDLAFAAARFALDRVDSEAGLFRLFYRWVALAVAGRAVVLFDLLGLLSHKVPSGRF